MLAGAITQRALRHQAQAQHPRAWPVERRNLGRQAVAQRVEGFHLQIPDHLALARQAPALLTLCPVKGLGLEIEGLATHTMHQAGMATARPATVGHRYTGLIKGVEQVAAIGNPLGDLDYSLNVGYISAKDRDVDLDGPSIRMMQLDAAINPGNSGGPLFDLRGNVVGVTTAKYSGETVTGATIEGIGFAIPINDVREILSELREYGRVPNRAQLGVMVGTVYSTNTARNGRVRDVTEDSAGAHAGLRDGDFILALDDYTVRTLSDLSAALRHYRGGQHATLTIERYGKTFRLPIVFDSKDDAVQNEEPTTSANALEPSEQDSPRP